MSDSTQTEQTRAVVQAIHDAASQRDVDTERQLFSEDLVIEEPPFLPYGGTYRGHEAFLLLSARIAEFVDFASLVVESMTVEDNLAFVVLRFRLWTGTEIIATEQWRVENGLAVFGRISWFDAAQAGEMVAWSPTDLPTG